MHGYVDPFAKRVRKATAAPSAEGPSGLDGVTRETGPEAQGSAARQRSGSQMDDEQSDEGPV